MPTIALTAALVVITVTLAWATWGIRRANEGRSVEQELRQGAEREPSRGFARRVERPAWSAPRAA